MELSFSSKDLEFRDEVRDFLANEYPKHVKEKIENGEPLTREDIVDWHKSLSAKGWMGFNWPVEYGGTGWSPAQIYIFQDRFLPDILNFDTWWCQGYSEPGSGSDLASLKTKAELINEDGKDYYIINGSKTWTTLAQNADWIFCLVRTDSSGKKQEGISFLLIDMKSPGIEVKPIITIDGDHEVNSVFFTDVKVPAENLIGEEGKGWTYAKFLLAHERFGIAGVGASKRQLERLKEISKDLGDDDLIAKVSQLEIDIMALEFTELRLLSALEGGGNPGAESSILKIKGTEIQQRLTELYVEAAGEFAIPYGGPDGYGSNVKPNGPEYTNDALSKYLNMRKVTIYGGSNEIQKNIISKFVLGV